MKVFNLFQKITLIIASRTAAKCINIIKAQIEYLKRRAIFRISAVVENFTNFIITVGNKKVGS